ncbi:MAG: hypothetical protein WBI94_04975 [Candidatus Cloacimonadaceae bacterium]
MQRSESEQIREGSPAYLAQMKQDIIQARRYLPADNWFVRRVGN